MKKWGYILMIVFVSMGIIVSNLRVMNTTSMLGLYILVIGSLLFIVGVRFFSSRWQTQILSAVGIFIIFGVFNISVGAYFEDGSIRFYSSFPRVFVLFYLGFVLTIYYFVAVKISNMIKEKYKNVVFYVFDVASVFLYYFALMFTTFVSPH